MTTTTATRVSREILEDRWATAILAPWRPGEYSPLGDRLRRVLIELIDRVAMVDLGGELDRGTAASHAYDELSDAMMAAIRRELLERLEAGALARHGWEGISERAPWEPRA
mgnify:CR=1 FL=1